MRTDHSQQIVRLRGMAEGLTVANETASERTIRLAFATAADLLEMHDATGISLDNWPAARGLVEHLTGEEVTPNHA